MNVKSFVKENRIKQEELAQLFECTQSNVSNIVSGKRNLTKLQIRLLIEKYGVDKVMPYADQGEMPQGAKVTVNAPVISGNEGPVQAGNNNKMELPPSVPVTDSASLIALMNNMLAVQQKHMQQYAEILASKDAELAKRDQQIDRMIDILEKK